MSLPQDLVIIRHGESEGNIAQAKSRNEGDHSVYTEAFRAQHGSRHRLTPRGILQAQAAGDWLRAHGLGSFDHAYIAEYIRAIETGGHLNLTDTLWQTSDALRERDSGLLDALPENERRTHFPLHARQAEQNPFFGSPPDGESLADVMIRLHAGFLPTLRAQNASERCIIVSHGRTIRALRAILEQMPFWVYEERERTHHPDHVVQNAHIFHYTRSNPENQTQIVEDFEWVRSICPWDPPRTDPHWRKIERPRFRSRDLLQIAEQFPRFLP